MAEIIVMTLTAFNVIIKGLRSRRLVMYHLDAMV